MTRSRPIVYNGIAIGFTERVRPVKHPYVLSCARYTCDGCGWTVKERRGEPHPYSSAFYVSSVARLEEKLVFHSDRCGQP